MSEHTVDAIPGSEPIAIVGAGPVGSLLALTLAQRGLDVTLFERRPDMRRQAMSAGRSINLAVSTRGLRALRAVGLEAEVLAQAVPMIGRMTHSVTGERALLRYGRDDTECIYSMSRGDLNKLLMTRAEATGHVRCQFEQRLTHYDFVRKIATFRDEGSGVERAVDAPVVLGCDGSASALRDAIATAVPGFTCDQAPLDFGYKELTIQPVTDGSGHGAHDGHGPAGRFALAPNALHIWPRGQFMLIALPNRDGSFTCTLFLPFAADPAAPDVPSFAQLHDAPAVQACFERWFADAVPHLPDLTAQFQNAPLGRMVTVKSWPWSHGGDRIGSGLLLGDAAHAIVPFFGQGMNCGFEDGSVFAELLDAQPERPVEWSGLFERFAAARKPNTDAIADLAVENFVEMRNKVADATFLLHRAVEAGLQQCLGDAYRTRYQLVTFTNVPYRIALTAGAIQAEVLAEVCRDIASPVQVDWNRAEFLMRERLLPLLRAHGIG